MLNRYFVSFLGVVSAVTVIIACSKADSSPARAEGGIVTAHEMKSAGWPGSETMTLPSDAELRRRLTPEQYHVTRENGTEAPFKNPFWDNHEAGLYVDIVSGEPLFTSKEKFESGTGWPSFFRPVSKDAVVEKTDREFGMTRTEVRSKIANSHLGHVFNDGPKPTGQRYCINSASLRFIPVSELEAQGYGDFLPLFQTAAAKTETATFAGGCFWGVEGYFQRVRGVISTDVGYTGGRTANPDYHTVCEGTTGHAEAVQVIFDPSIIFYEALLNHFWKIHDPTTPDRQGNDVGSQYRPAIFTHSDEQMRVALAAKEKLSKSGKYSRPIATEITPIGTFYRGEEYHQDYLMKNPGGYCHIDLSNVNE